MTSNTTKRSAEDWVLRSGLNFEDPPSWPNEREFFSAMDNSIEELSYVSGSTTPPAKGTILYSVVYNELERLPSFLQYYRSIGICHFVLINNNSSDETQEYLRNQPDVELYFTDQSFNRSVFGGLWIGGLVRKRDLGRWILKLDADELFVYDKAEEVSINQFTDALERWGMTQAFAPMIDVYTDEFPSDNAQFDKFGFHTVPFFDPITSGNKEYYRWNVRHTNLSLSGGPRNRNMRASLLSTRDSWALPHIAEYCLDKTPLVLWDDKTCYPSPHYPWPRLFNNRCQLAVSLHFKLGPNIINDLESAIERNEKWNASAEEKASLRYLNKSGLHSFKHINSVQYHTSADLTKARLLPSIDWASKNDNFPVRTVHNKIVLNLASRIYLIIRNTLR